MNNTGIFLTNDWIKYAVSTDHLDGKSRTIFMCLCYFMNYSTGLSKPSQYALMKMTGIKRSSISRALKNLETLGIIEVIPHISTKGRRNIYKIRIYQEGKINAPSEASTVKLNDIDIENLIEKRFHLE